jgi:hypothetical protein
MVNLFDIMQTAQSGAAVTNMSRQFGLSPADTQRAVEALLPAFSMGLHRAAQNPAMLAPLLAMMGSGQYTPFFDTGAGTRGAANGGDVLAQVFGSPEVTRQIAQQASSMTGIGVQVLQEMMPMIGATLIGGLFKYASLEGLGDWFGQWSNAFKQAHASQVAANAPPPPPAGPFGAWGSMLDTMVSGGAAGSPLPPQPRMPTPAPAPATPPTSASIEAPLAHLSRMFETGHEVQSQQAAHLQRIFDTVWGAPPPVR